MARRIGLLLAPLLLVIAAEAAFRLGAWYPWVSPISHAGTTRYLSQAWQAHRGPIDIVTLGSSRAVYGIDHADLAKAASAHGLAHASFAMSGSHWMSVRAVTRWIEAHRPEVKARVIALSVVDFEYPGNGAYELSIVEPLRSGYDAHWIQDHVPFRSDQVATYGIYSSLFLHREDIQDFVRRPGRRFQELARASAGNPQKLFEGLRTADTSCALKTQTLRACADSLGDGTMAIENLRRQCRSLLPARLLDAVVDLGASPDRQRARQLIREELRSPRWRGKTEVVLMPTHHAWMRELVPPGFQAWVRETLRPLEEEGAIRVLDYTRFLDRDGLSDCHSYWDIYHQNSQSAAVLTSEIAGRFEASIYRELSAGRLK